MEERQEAKDHRYIDGDRNVGEQAEQPIGRQHEHHYEDGARDRGVLAGLDRIQAEAWSDHTLLNHRELCGQRSSAQQDRQIIGALDGEIARNLARSAKYRLADHGRRYHLVVQDDREGTPDILLRRPPEPTRAGAVELEVDDRLAIALIE